MTLDIQHTRIIIFSHQTPFIDKFKIVSHPFYYSSSAALRFEAISKVSRAKQDLPFCSDTSIAIVVDFPPISETTIRSGLDQLQYYSIYLPE